MLYYFDWILLFNRITALDIVSTSTADVKSSGAGARQVVVDGLFYDAADGNTAIVLAASSAPKFILDNWYQGSK